MPNGVRDVGVAAVTVNGKDMGITWTKPFRVDITGALSDDWKLRESGLLGPVEIMCQK